MPISPSCNTLSGVLHRRLGVALLCLGGVSCGGTGPTDGVTGAMNIAPSSVVFATVPGGTPDPKTVGISPATVNLTGLTTTTAYTGTPPSPWLGTSLGSTEATLANPAILTLQVTNSSLPAGTYKATVTVSSPVSANSPQVAVTLTIEAATALAIVTQPSGTAASGTVLAQAAVVQLLTAGGNPVGQPGVDVTVALEGAGSLAGTATSTTDAQGRATFDDLAVTALIGEHTLLFTAPGLDQVRSNPIAITVGAAARIAASSIASQSAEAGTPVNEPPVALVTDEAGNPAEGVAVTFAVTQGGGVIDPTTPQTTGADGLASSSSWTMGSIAGANAATATAVGLQGSPLEFDATGTNGGVVPGPVSGPNSTVTAATPLVAGASGAVTVTARDAGNNLIGGATVTLASTGSNFVFGSTTLTTGTNGLTLGKATTTYTSTKAETKSISAQITASGVTVSPAPASVIVTPGAPSAATSTVAASPATVIALANTSTITITVKDANGNVISGRGVTLVQVGGSGGVVLTQPSSTTGSDGKTTGKVGSTTGGAYQVQATVSGGPAIVQTATVTVLLSFAGDIQPIFQTPFDLGVSGTTTPCTSCHLPIGSSVPDLSFDRITDAHDAGNVVVPGISANSLLIKALLHDPSLNPDMSEFMPSSTQFLPADVIAKIAQWINQNQSSPLTP